MDINAREASTWSQLFERDERCQELIELAPDGIIVHDGKRILLANAAALQLAGATTREEMVGWPIDRFLAPPYLKSFDRQFAKSTLNAGQAAPERGPATRETFRQLDGTPVQVEVYAFAYIDGDTPSVHLVLHNLTERLASESIARQLDLRLQEAQRMEIVGALAGGMAHEVNNMMSVIIGCAEFLRHAEELPKDCLADVGEIMRAAERSALITRQLLAFSRRAVHTPQHVDLARAVRTAEPVIRRLLAEGQLLVIEANGSPSVWVDPNQLEQVIINLALNARDAMPLGGTLTIVTGELSIRRGAAPGQPDLPVGEYGTLVVRDTGSGMDAETQKRIFEPFFTTKAVGHGTGLGLSAAQGILTQSGGYIVVTSAIGQGATFTVYLPIPVAAEADAEPMKILPSLRMSPLNRGITVLVVDDEPAVLTVAARGLQRGGLRTLQAPSGAEALAMIERHGVPDVVVTDVRMPGMGGAELARRILERWPAIPVIFMTGYPADDLLRQGIDAADHIVVQKPFTPAALVDIVLTALSKVARSEQ